MDTDTIQLLKMHPCSRGLDSETLSEIVEHCQVIQLVPGQILHKPNDVVEALHLIVSGRVRQTLVDLAGKRTPLAFQTAGGQFGGLAATSGEPIPIECVAEDPTTLLRIEVQAAMELTARYPAFRLNISRQIAKSIKESGLGGHQREMSKLTLVFHQGTQTREMSCKLYQRLEAVGDSIAVLTDSSQFSSSTPSFPWANIDEHGPQAVRTQVADWLESERRVFADVGSNIEVARVYSALEFCKQVFWCVTPENWQSSVPILESFLDGALGWRDKIVVVWLLDRERTAPLATELRNLTSRDLKISFSKPGPNESCLLNNGLNRWVQLSRGVQIGLALGGGAARGMAHLGVLRAFEQNGIYVDQIAGTSAGAMTGTIYASGMGIEYSIDRFVNDLTPSWAFRRMPRGEQWYLLYKYRTGQFDPMLRKYLKDARIEQLPLSMKTIAVDLVEGQVVVRDSGDAVHGIVESINLPVLSVPINRDGKSLVDGGMINNVPADVLVETGCNFVIAVSVTSKMETNFVQNRPDTPTASMRKASTIQTILRTLVVQSTNVNSFGVQAADIVIEPDVTAFDLTAFTRTNELAAIGEQTTQSVVPEIEKLLAGLDPQLFST